MVSDKTRVEVTMGVRDQLVALKRGGESINAVIARILDHYNATAKVEA
jgi:hypothetical protein